MSSAFATGPIPPSEMPAAPRVAPGQVVSPSMSEALSPASAMAARQASAVSASGGRINRRPTSDMPTPVIATRSSNLSSLAFGRTATSGSAASALAADASPPPSDVGAKSGSQTSSCCSNRTCTRRPTCTSSGFASTMLVVRRTRGSSSSATIATTYGGAGSGSHCWWLIVNPTTVPRPETAAGSSSRCRHDAHTDCDGCQRRAHAGQRFMQSRPSRPPVQKASVSGSTRGSGRTVVLRRMAWRIAAETPLSYDANGVIAASASPSRASRGTGAVS